jgi:hypothetical protein
MGMQPFPVVLTSRGAGRTAPGRQRRTTALHLRDRHIRDWRPERMSEYAPARGASVTCAMLSVPRVLATRAPISAGQQPELPPTRSTQEA